MEQPAARGSRADSIVAQAALVELPWLCLTMGALLGLFALVDAATHPADQATWRLVTSLGPTAVLLILMLAARRHIITVAAAGWATVGGSLLIGATTAWSAHESGSPTELSYEFILMIVLGAAALSTVTFTVAIVSLAAMTAWIIMTSADGSVPGRWVDWLVVLLVSQAASVIVHMSRVRGLHRLALAQDDLERVATSDPLTGIASRYGLELAYPLIRAQAARTASDIFVIFIDVDGLKQVNDNFGHDEGDRLIRTVGRALVTACRASDLVARWGGDEFVVLGSGAAPSAQRFTSAVESEITAVWRAKAQVGISLGIAAMAADASDLDALVTSADADMYSGRRLRRQVHEVARDDEALRGSRSSTKPDEIETQGAL